MNSSCYDKLYENMKARFTVVNDNSEYTLGDYMRMQAAKKENRSTAVAVRSTRNEGALVSVINYVSDKLAVKSPAPRDKTIRRFPVRASASAFLSAVAACSLVLSIGIVGARTLNLGTPTGQSASVSESTDDTVIIEDERFEVER